MVYLMAEYYMFNKPRGCISACIDPRHKTVMDYFPKDLRDELFHIGRLDKDTEGLLIISDDGALCNRLMMPQNGVRKTYFFWALGDLSEESIKKIERGVNIFENDDFITSPAELTVLKKAKLLEIKQFLTEDDIKIARRRGEMTVTSGKITITEGKKHQVKKMIGFAGCRVLYLKRISIGLLSLDETLLPGEYRPLTKEELILLES